MQILGKILRKDNKRFERYLDAYKKYIENSKQDNEVFEQLSHTFEQEFHAMTLEISEKLCKLNLCLSIDPSKTEKPMCVCKKNGGEIVFQCSAWEGLEIFIEGVRYGRENDEDLRQMGL